MSNQELLTKIEEEKEYHWTWPMVNCTPEDWQQVDKGWIEALEWVQNLLNNE